MRYRGFELYATPTMGTERVRVGKEVFAEGFFCEVYDAADSDMANQLDHFTLAVGYDIPEISLEALDNGLRRYADEHYTELTAAKLDVQTERKDMLLGRFITSLRNLTSDAKLYDTLSRKIGMDDDEIRAAGYASLAPYFDREDYARVITEYMLDIAAENTTTGSWQIGFGYLNERYGIDLPNDQQLMEYICDYLRTGYPDMLEGFEVDEDQFTLRLDPDFCPFVSDDEDEEETNEMITAEDLVEQAVHAANAPECCSDAEQAENMLEMLGANIMDDDIYHDEDEHPGFVPSM